MTGLPTASLVPAGTAIRLSLPAGAAPGDRSEVHPVYGITPPPRDETRARQPRQDTAEDRGSRVRTDQRPFGQTRPRQTSATDFTAPAATPDFVGSNLFLAQVLSQKLGPAGTVVALHRDGPSLGSDAYRRAGGEPVIYSEQPQLLRIAV